MLSLATHEPYFRVLREDVFANDTSPTACRMCGQEGHYAAQCTGTKADIQKKPPSDKKPFIFLDVATLREYLEVELDVPQAPFPFSLEQAIDDWVLLIFFVGNDFLPHLPSLEIREGAIDTLLKIWKQELPRMGGYLTHHGQLELWRAQIILEGLAEREDEIFRRRREGLSHFSNHATAHDPTFFSTEHKLTLSLCYFLAEGRQDQNAKRRKLEQQNKSGSSTGPSPNLAETAQPTAPTISSAAPSAHPSLPQRPSYNFAATADSIGFGAAPTAQSIQNTPIAAEALAGSNRDVVANRRAIRMANMSAAEVLKAEMSGLSSVKPDRSLPVKPPPAVSLTVSPPATLEASPMSTSPPIRNFVPGVPDDDLDDVPGFGNHRNGVALPVADVAMKAPPVESDADADGEPDPDTLPIDRGSTGEVEQAAGTKRRFEEGPGVDDGDEVTAEDDDDAVVDGPLALKVNPDGTVEQADTVKFVSTFKLVVMI
jgi:5'-3' exoribonuclease 2